jgi:SRSO17 transposase
MDSRALASADRRLQVFLADKVALLGRSERRQWAEVYVRGLLMEGQRKSIEPIAARVGEADGQGLQQFVNQSPWAWEPLQEALAVQMMDRLLPEAVLIVDETSFPKQGAHSVGVARQYCGTLGKTANCQVAVSVHLGTDSGCVPLSWELYLPVEWTDDAQRRKEVGIPDEIRYRTKNELALQALDRILGWGIGRRVVLADAGYGNSFDFREALCQRGLPYCVQVALTTKAWTHNPDQGPPPRTRRPGRPRKRAPIEDLPVPLDLVEIARSLPAGSWETVRWRVGSRGALSSRFARCAVWLAHRWTEHRKLPDHAIDLLIEWPEGAANPTKVWLAELPGQKAGLRRLVRLAKGRWRIELDYRELKEEVGLDHFEGRSWRGWHHHVTLVSLAYAFLALETLRSKKNSILDPSPDAPSPSDPSGALGSLVSTMSKGL